MIIIRFPNTQSKRQALSRLAGRFAFKSRASGEMLVPEDALPFLAVQGVAFAVEAPEFRGSASVTLQGSVPSDRRPDDDLPV